MLLFIDAHVEVAADDDVESPFVSPPGFNLLVLLSMAYYHNELWGRRRSLRGQHLWTQLCAPASRSQKKQHNNPFAKWDLKIGAAALLRLLLLLCVQLCAFLPLLSRRRGGGRAGGLFKDFFHCNTMSPRCDPQIRAVTR